MSVPRGTKMEEEVSIPMSVSEARKWLKEDGYHTKRGLSSKQAAYSIAQTIIVASFANQTENIIDLLSNATAWTNIIVELNEIVNAKTPIKILGAKGDEYEFYPNQYISEEMNRINRAMELYLKANPVRDNYLFVDFKKIYNDLLTESITTRIMPRPQRQPNSTSVPDRLETMNEILNKNIQLGAEDLRKQQDYVKSQYTKLEQKTQNFNTQVNQFNQLFNSFKKDISKVETLNTELRTAQKSMEQSQKDNEILRNLLKQKSSEYGEKIKEMNELQKAFFERQKEYNDLYNSQSEDDIRRKGELLQERDMINERANELESEIHRLEAYLNTAQNQAENERLRAERAEKKIDSTMSSLLNLTEETGRLTGQIAGTRQQMAMYKDQIVELKDEIGDQKAKGNAQQQKMMEIIEEGNAYKIRTEVAEVREEMTREQYNKLEKKSQHYEEEMNRMRDYILQLTRERERLIGQNEQLQYQLQEGVQAFGRLQLDYKTVVEDKDKLLTENIELRREGNALVSNIHMLTYDAYTHGQATEAFANRDLKEQIRIKDREKEDLEEKKEKLESKVKEEEIKIEKKKKKKERIKEQVEQTKKEKEQLSKDFAQLKLDYAVQSKEIEHYKEKIEELKSGALVPINQVIPSNAQEQDLMEMFDVKDYIRKALDYMIGDDNVNHRKIYEEQLEMYNSADEMIKKYPGLHVTNSGKAYAQFTTDNSRYTAAFIGIDKWIGNIKSVTWVRVDQYVNWATNNRRKLALQMENLSYWNGIIKSSKVPLLKGMEDPK